MSLRALILAGTFVLMSGGAWAAPLSVELTPAASNPGAPQMGDNLRFRTVIRNNGVTPIDGMIAWISLVRVDRGKVRPVDLEDWSANKAVTAARLAPGGTLRTDWSLRLIQAGAYRVVVSAVSRDSINLTASPFADFTVRQKPVVESRRVLPIALGIPLLLGGMMLWRLPRRKSRHRSNKGERQ